MGQSLKEQCKVLNLEMEEFVFTAVSDSAIGGPQEQKYVKKDKRPLAEHILDEFIFSWKVCGLFTHEAVYPLTQILSLLAYSESWENLLEVVLIRETEMLILWFLNTLPSAVPPLATPASWTSSCRKQKLVSMALHLPSGKGTPARA